MVALATKSYKRFKQMKMTRQRILIRGGKTYTTRRYKMMILRQMKIASYSLSISIEMVSVSYQSHH